MLMIRLQRTGKKHQPSYRLVLVDSRRATKSGSFIEILGSYDVRKSQAQFKGEKIKDWIKNGAQISDTVYNLLIKEKVIEGKKRFVKIGKKRNPPAGGEKAQRAEAVETPAELQNKQT